MSHKLSSFNPEFVAELRKEMLVNKESNLTSSRTLSVSQKNAQYVKEFHITRTEINQAYARAREKK